MQSAEQSTSMVSYARWNEAAPPAEEELRERFEAENLRPYAWSNGPGDVYGAHSHGYHKVIYCVTGSIRFDLPASALPQGWVELQPGDRLDLPPGTPHSAVVGPQGVLCLEGHR